MSLRIISADDRLREAQGKTTMALTAAAHLIKHGAVRSVLVLGPKRVVESVWEAESYKWAHLQHLTFSYILGKPQERLYGLTRQADVYLCTYARALLHPAG